MKKDEIHQINQILKSFPRHFYKFGNPPNYIPSHGFHYGIHEMCLINKNWDERPLEGCLHDTWDENHNVDYDLICKRYDKKEKDEKTSTRNIPVSFYVPTNLPIEDEFSLDTFNIKKVDPVKKKQLLDRQYLKEVISDDEYNKLKNDHLHFIEFSTFQPNTNPILEDFYSTFHMLKGIVEYSYCSWDFEPIQSWNKRQSSHFQYPTFIYILGENYELIDNYLQIKDIEIHRRLMDSNDSREKDKKRKFQETLSFFTGYKDSKNQLYSLLSSCMRLYCLGIDSPYKDQSFLYFWNLLEEITLRSKNGDTDEILSRGNFLSRLNYSMFPRSFNELKTIRNQLVHHGINRVTNVSLGLIRWMCEECLSTFFLSVDLLFKNHNDLEMLYRLSNLKFRDGTTLSKEDFKTIKNFSIFFPERKNP